MLIIPITGKISFKNPPVITIIIILINSFVLFFIQSGDNERFSQAIDYYFKSGLAEIEIPRYMKYKNIEADEISEPDPSEKTDKEMLDRYMKLNNDFQFLKKLRNNEIIASEEPDYSNWKELRKNYDEKILKVVSWKYGFRPAYQRPTTFFTHMFLHGGFSHLLGNMIFLWLVGCILEMVCGRLFYSTLYIILGLFAVVFFWIFNMESTTPLIGASGAIAGLMGLLTVLFGLKKINIFLYLGFYFHYFKVPAIALLPVWLGKEIYYQFFYESVSNVAYTAHIGGLLGGALCGFICLKFKIKLDQDVLDDKPEDEISPMLEQALQCISKLDFDEGRSLLVQVLEKDPGNYKALTHIFNIDKQNPKTRQFHKTAEMLLLHFIKSKNTYDLLYDFYKEYENLVKNPNLSPGLSIRLCLIFTANNHIDESVRIISVLLKTKPDTPGIPKALMVISNACREKGMTSNWKKCQQIICTKYPNSHEARIINSKSQIPNLK